MLSQSGETSADEQVVGGNDEFSGASSKQQGVDGEAKDIYMISEYNRGIVRDFSLQPSERLSFTEHLNFDFQKTVWYSRMENVFFVSSTGHEDLFINSNECGYHLYIANNVLQTAYIYKDKESGEFQSDAPVIINEVIPKIRVKQLNTDNGFKQVLVVGRKVLDEQTGNSAMTLSDDPLPADLDPLQNKSFGIYVEDGAKLVLLDQHYACTNVRHHNNTVVTGGGFLVVEGELHIGIAAEGINLISTDQVEKDKESPVYFLQPTRSRTLCWGLGVRSSGEWCLLMPDNGKYSVKNYGSGGLYEVLQKHSSKPWSRSVEEHQQENVIRDCSSFK